MLSGFVEFVGHRLNRPVLLHLCVSCSSYKQRHIDSSDQPDDVREHEPHVELPTSSADNLIPEALSHKMEESTKQVVPETDSNAHGRPSRQRKPPSRYGAWVSG